MTVDELLAREEGFEEESGAEAARAARLLESFARSALARELKAARRLHREAPFAFMEGDTIIEGAIDLIAELADGRLCIVDWKTDDVEGDALELRVETYRQQAQVYRRAVAAAAGREPDRVVFWFLRRGEGREIG